MAHVHPIIDADAHFIINAATRVISNSDDKKLMIVKGDHNSEKVTFELPRYIEDQKEMIIGLPSSSKLLVSNDSPFEFSTTTDGT